MAKYLVIELKPETQKFRGHTETLKYMCQDIALYNGGNYGNPDERDADLYIENLFKECNKGTYDALKLEKIKDCTYSFGNINTEEYTHYGTITKINIL